MPNIVIINNQHLKLLINLLIELTIKYHSGKIIPVAFRSGEFRGTFRYELRNARIPPEQETTGMTLLAEPPANFHSSGMHRIPPESPESGRNLWGTDKTSMMCPLPLPCSLSRFLDLDFYIVRGQIYQQQSNNTTARISFTAGIKSCP